MVSEADKIECNPAILEGKPVVRGTRLAVEFVVGLLAHGWSDEQLLANFPGLSRDHIRACIEFVASHGEDL